MSAIVPLMIALNGSQSSGGSGYEPPKPPKEPMSPEAIWAAIIGISLGVCVGIWGVTGQW